MSKEFVTVRNTVTGEVGKVRRSIAEHEVFGKCLEIVPAGTKPLRSLDQLVREHRDLPLAVEVEETKEQDPEEEED